MLSMRPARVIVRVRLRDFNFVRSDVDGAGAPKAERLAIFWLLAFGIEINSEFNDVSDVFFAVRVMNVPVDTRARQHQFPGIGAHDFPLLTDGPLHERAATCSVCCGRVIVTNVGRSASLILLKTGNRMMSDLPAFHCPWTDFNGTNPTCFCETCRNDWVSTMRPGRRLSEGTAWSG